MSLTIVLGASVLALAWLVQRILKMGSRGRELPPGPPTIPVLGNALQFPTSRVHLQFTEWSKQYGDVFSLKIGDQTMVILSNASVVSQLLEQRNATTSDRPTMYILDLITGGYNLPMMRYSQLWKDYRRALRDLLSREACVSHLTVQRAEATQLMYDILKQPEEFFTHVRRFSFSVILSAAFGMRCPRYSNSYASRFFAVQRDYEHIAGPGATPPLDMFPILKYVPERWASWKTVARNVRDTHQQLWGEMVDAVVARINSGNRRGTFMEDIWDKREKLDFDREKIIYLASNLGEAGSDTSAVFIQSFMCFMVAHPEVRKRAQQEIDDVVGSSRSPSFEDWNSLPYLQAIVQEVHRFRPITPQLLPHATMSDEMLNGFLIPKGSIIFVNLWAIYHDPESFAAPETFNPDRFLESEFGTVKGADNTGRKSDMMFGCGRRLCPGMELAINSIKINTMNLLWGFSFEKAKDANGNPIPIDLDDTTDGVLLTQKPFKCVISPRTPHHESIIRSNYAASRGVFSQFENELKDDERKYVAEW